MDNISFCFVFNSSLLFFLFQSYQISKTKNKTDIDIVNGGYLTEEGLLGAFLGLSFLEVGQTLKRK